MAGQRTRSEPTSENMMAKERITPPLKWHGGKYYLTKPIIDLMPKKHRLYVELFGGGLAVFWGKNPVGVNEIVNDVNGYLMNFYGVLQREKLFKKFLRRVQAIPFGRDMWEEAGRKLAEQPKAHRVARAAWFFVLNRMSHAGRMDAFTGITKTRTRGDRNAEVNAWQGAVEGLREVHERLMRVVVENRPATVLMPNYDIEGCVMYADPPYVASSRSAPNVYGDYEMRDADHAEFLEAANAVKHAKVLISGYRCELYDAALKGWNRHTFDVANHAAGGKSKQREDRGRLDQLLSRVIDSAKCKSRRPGSSPPAVSESSKHHQETNTPMHGGIE